MMQLYNLKNLIEYWPTIQEMARLYEIYKKNRSVLDSRISKDLTNQWGIIRNGPCKGKHEIYEILYREAVGKSCYD
jgi:hypothetical protein